MSFRRYANTDEQEEACERLEEWSKKAKYILHYGTSIGKSPQTVIFDHEYQDGVVSVNREGTITVHVDECDSYDAFVNLIKEEEEDG
jgi:hypothetical protein